MATDIAYVLKAFGRTSETFITNEIYLLERMGVKLRLFSLKTLEGQKRHATLDAIEAPVIFLPETDEFGMPFRQWLSANVPKFAASHRALFRRRPMAYLAVLADALSMCIRYRERALAWPRKIFFKEFLQGGFIAHRILEEGGVRHIHSHFCHGATTVAMFAARLAGLPFSFTAHAKDIYLQELNPGDLLPVKMRRARFAVTCTEANKTHLDALRPAGAAPVHAIYHGLDTRLFTPPAQRLPSAPARILSVGRFVEKKGFEYLVEACSILRDRGYKFECLIVGGADKYQKVVEDCIGRLQLADVVRIQNAVTQEQLRDIYSASTVFALPCQVLDNGDRDGIPNVLAEAMAMRLPVVSTNISGIPEIVRTGANGLLVPPRNAAALADAMASLLDDPFLRRRLGEQARETILDVFDSRRNTQRLAGLLLDGSPAAARRDVAEAIPC